MQPFCDLFFFLVREKKYILGSGLHFDGANDYIKIPNAPAIQFNFANSFSFVYWIKFNAVGFQIIQEFSNAMYSITLMLNNATLNYYKMQGNQYVLDWISGNTTITPNVLYQIVIINKGTGANNMEIYLNAVKETKTTQFNDNITGTTNSDMNIGGRTTVFNITSNIYDFKIFNKALSQEEITKLYNFKIPKTAKENITLDINFESVYKEASNIYTPENIANNKAQLIGYPAGATAIVDINGNAVQNIPA